MVLAEVAFRKLVNSSIAVREKRLPVCSSGVSVTDKRHRSCLTLGELAFLAGTSHEDAERSDGFISTLYTAHVCRWGRRVK